MIFDMTALDRAARYKILGSSVTPRPIAWVTTRSVDGIANAAPYSFFNVMGDDPPTIALGLLRGASGGAKDTATNIIATGEFVVHTVTEADAAAMNVTCMDAPPGIDELVAAGISTVASAVVAPPRIPSAPVAFECRTLHRIETGPGQNVIIGEVLVAHVRDEFILDAARFHFDSPAMQLVARLHGSGWYSRQTDVFQMQRPSYAEWKAAQATA
jgi:flavin reductase (DIM6/NTAB) family NADH-FMN oxidoreductase RutF